MLSASRISRRLSVRPTACTRNAPLIKGLHDQFSHGPPPVDVVLLWGMRPKGHGYVAVLHQFAAASHADIQIRDLFSQGIPVDPEKLSTFGLIARGCIKRNFNQRRFDLA